MTTGTNTGMVQTVLGPIKPEDLGVTLTHEHLLIDIRVTRGGAPTDPSGKAFYDKPVNMETVGYIRYYFTPNGDTSVLSDIDTAVDEAKLYKKHGGGTLVDATSIGLSRDPVGLQQISLKSGVSVIMGSSYYVQATHSPDIDHKKEDEIVNEIVSDITKGVGDTQICSGIIGEVGCTWPLTDNEYKILRASARAQQLTGAPLLVHPGRNEHAPKEIIQILSDAGADISRTIMAHLDRTVFEKDTLSKIAQSGCYLEWDLFGREQSYYPLTDTQPERGMPSDTKRMEDIAWAIKHGFGNKVLVAHDICSKDRLIKFGGHGYFYILGHIIPRMRALGFKEEDINNILVRNPADALTFTKPRAA